MISKLRLIKLAFGAVLCAPFVVPAAEAVPTLFLPDNRPGISADVLPAGLGSRVAVSRQRVQITGELNGGTFLLDLGGDSYITLPTVEAAADGAGSLSLHGALLPYKDTAADARRTGEFVYTVVNGSSGETGVHGAFRPGDGRVFELHNQGDSYLLTEYYESDFPDCAGEVETDVHFVPDRAADRVVAADNVQIDILVVYTPEAAAAAGGTAAIEALATTAITLANNSYTNSGISQTLRLVGTVNANYSESVSCAVFDSNETCFLNRLSGTSDGYMDEIHTLRNTYGADMVALIYESGDYCGMGYMGPGEYYAFSVTNRSCIAGNYSFTHELGHNMGAHHDRANAGGGAAYAYSYGWRWLGSGNVQYRSVMSYAPGTRINQFSSPLVSYSGAATGVNNSEDNALTLNQTGPIIAAIRSESGGGGGGGGEGGGGEGGGGGGTTPTPAPTATPLPFTVITGISLASVSDGASSYLLATLLGDGELGPDGYSIEFYKRVKIKKNGRRVNKLRRQAASVTAAGAATYFPTKRGVFVAKLAVQRSIKSGAIQYNP